MTIDRNSDLARAFRIARRDTGRPAFRAQGYVAPTYRGESYASPLDGIGHAAHALTIARGMVAAPAPIYGGQAGRVYPDTDSAFRETIAAHDVDGGPDHTGWYDNPHGESFRDGSGLCFGVVCRLPGRKGMARFVAGYQFGGHEGGPTLDLSTVYESPADSSWETPDAMRDAARAADELARVAAEEEKEYQTAWGAGSAYADKLESEEAARAEALAILKERRAARAADPGAYPALCAAIRGKVESLVELIRESREERATLANGDSDPFYFWTGEERLRAAFCEGAGLDRFPA